MTLQISLAAARVNAGLNIREAAALLNITAKTLSNWENGKTSPKSDNLADMVKLYGIPVEALILPKKSAESGQ